VAQVQRNFKQPLWHNNNLRVLLSKQVYDGTLAAMKPMWCHQEDCYRAQTQTRHCNPRLPGKIRCLQYAGLPGHFLVTWLWFSQINPVSSTTAMTAINNSRSRLIHGSPMTNFCCWKRGSTYIQIGLYTSTCSMSMLKSSKVQNFNYILNYMLTVWHMLRVSMLHILTRTTNSPNT